jgi:porin
MAPGCQRFLSAKVRLSIKTIFAAILLLAFQGGQGALAQAWWTEAKDGIPVPSIATSLPQNGDPSGIRRRLSDYGIVYGLEYTSDTLANVHGGSRTGTIYQGKLQGIVTVDFGKLAGWQGLTLFANAYQLHNTGRIRRDYVGGINTIAAIEAVPTTRLSEIWLEQKFAGGAASIRFGQLAADAEFIIAESSTWFLQSDYPTITASNMPSGGPAYPLSTPGVRLRVDPTREVSLLLAVFNGDPAGPGLDDPQDRNRYGLNFRVHDPALVIGEVQFRRNPGATDPSRLYATLKLGGWRHFGKFDDQRLANDGSLLANPAGSGVPLQHRGDWGVYAVVEQQLWRPASGAPDSGVVVYSRMSASPSDRNLINAYIDGGVTVAGLVPKRPDDKFGVSMIYARFSDAARDFDRDTIAFSGVPRPVRNYEVNLEFAYVAQIVPGWTVQPVLTRVWHPNGDSSRNAIVGGARSIWRF